MRNVYKLNPFGLSRKMGERIAYPRQLGGAGYGHPRNDRFIDN